MTIEEVIERGDKERIKRYIDIDVANHLFIILYLNENILDDDLYDYIMSKSNDFGKDIIGVWQLSKDNNFDLFKSKKLLLKFANNVFSNFDKFLELVPEEYLEDVILFCAINGMSEPNNPKYQKYYRKDYEEAFELGYVCTFRTEILDEKTARLFLSKGQTLALDRFGLFNGEKIPTDLFIYALDNCKQEKNDIYLDSSFNTYLNQDEELKKIIVFCLKNNHLDFIISQMNKRLTNSIEVGNYYINQKEYFISTAMYELKGTMAFEDFLEKNNILDKILDFVIYTNKSTKLTINLKQEDEYYDFEKIIESKYENYNIIKQFLKYSTDSLEINNDNVSNYFTENGPTKLYYSNFMFENDVLFNSAFREDGCYEELYKDERQVLSYINFRKKIYIKNRVSESIYFDWIKIKDNFEKYFDENGPTQDFFDFTLFDEKLINLYNKLYDLEEIYPSRPDIKQYYIFRKQYSSFDFSNININNINEYFDAEGPTKKIFDRALLKNYFFNNIFKNNEIYIKRYADNPEILQYIKFINMYGNIFSEFIKYENISVYFDENGPTQDFFDFTLFDEKLINLYNKLYDLEEIYPSRPDIKQYYIFRKQYSSFDFSNININNINEYFDAEGPTKKIFDRALLKNYFFNNIFKNNEIYIKRYADNPEILQYIKFINMYGNIFSEFIKYENISVYFDENGYTNELVNFFNNNKEYTKELLSNLVHDNNVLNNLNSNFLSIFKEYIVNTLLNGVDNPYEKYEYLANNIGPKLLFNLENNSVKNLINYRIEDLDKLFRLFDTKATEISSERIYSSFVQSLLTFKFKKECREIVDVFTNINALIVNASKMEIDIIFKVIDFNLNRKSNAFITRINERFRLSNNSKFKIWMTKFQGRLGIIHDERTNLKKWIIRIGECLELDAEGYKELKKAILECKNMNQQPLRDICRKFLEKKQKEYYKENRDNVLIELGLPITFDKQDATTKLYNYFLQNIDYQNFIKMREQLKNSFDYENVSGFIEQISMDKSDFNLVLNISNEQFELIIAAIRNKKKPHDSVKKEFSYFKRFMNQYSKYILSNDIADKELLNDLNVKKSVKIPLKDIDIISILNELDFNIFINTIGNDEKILSNLNKLISKYYIGRLPNNIGENIGQKYDITLPGGINNIGTFLTKYYQLLLRKQKILKTQNVDSKLEDIYFTFMEAVELISVSNSETYEVKRLIGTNEYLDFVSNREPNSGFGGRTEREEKLALLVDYLYSVDSVTIPTGDIIIKAKNKKINFIVGNRTNPANICHGERTGACMRIGGVGEGLFLKCITDKNWFHIRIEDPETHEYVSRVSGFRNGNSVYLNQLRDVAKGCKYTNEDLQCFISEFAQYLIKQTENSEYPIENVFINTRYAMNDFKSQNGKSYNLGCSIKKEYNLAGLSQFKLRNGENIWTDVETSAVLLATTAEGMKTKNGYVSLLNGPDNTELYPAARDKIYGLEYVESEVPKHCFVSVSKDELFEKINRVNCMKAKLLGSDYRFYISDIGAFENDLFDGYASSDWYVYVDNNLVIHTDFISEIKKDNEIVSYAQSSVAQSEMECYKKILERKYNLNAEVKHAI